MLDYHHRSISSRLVSASPPVTVAAPEWKYEVTSLTVTSSLTLALAARAGLQVYCPESEVCRRVMVRREAELRLLLSSCSNNPPRWSVKSSAEPSIYHVKYAGGDACSVTTHSRVTVSPGCGCITEGARIEVFCILSGLIPVSSSPCKASAGPGPMTCSPAPTTDKWITRLVFGSVLAWHSYSPLSSLITGPI